ncbi:MAG: NADH-quinone oxidoreductase subunit J [Saprospiraceae bacterium]|nr:NADH-quinone oxidoreductase subunit J [Saprospiraceae bacterium]
MSQYLFLTLALVSVATALLMVLSRNPVHSVLYLIATFFAIAGQYVTGAIAAGSLLVVMVGALKGSTAAVAQGPHKSDVGLVENLGKVLFTDFVVPFEIAGILFLAAMVGAVLVGKRDTKL